MTSALLLLPFMAWAADPVGLGVANSFAVLAGTTITNTGATTINGDVGLHDGTETPGLTPEMVNGEFHIANDEALAAKNALTAAYIEVAGRTADETLGEALGGTTVFGGGVYASASGAFTISGSVTLDAEGDPDAIFVFQMASTLTTGVGSSVVFANGAQACNVYWQVGSSADLFSNTNFQGTILALTSINLQNGATISGRALARNGEVTMDSNTITQVGCAAPPVASTTTSTVAATTSTVAATTSTVAATTSTTAVPAITATTADINALVTPTTIAFPEGGAQTGGNPTSGSPDMTLVAVGAVLLASAAGAFGWRMRSVRRNS